MGRETSRGVARAPGIWDHGLVTGRDSYRNLGHETELMLIALDGRVDERPHHRVARWPSRPDYGWGNLIVFDAPPVEGDLPRWKAIFERELGDAGVRHHAFAWDSRTGERGAIEPFLADGFTEERCVTLVAEAMAVPDQAADDVRIRALTTDDDWAAVTEAERVNAWGADEASVRANAKRRMDRFRAMASRNSGDWFGAFDEDRRLVGSCGIFLLPDGSARYQSVLTAPVFRRCGIASRLVAEVGRAALERLGARRLVITADEGSDAARLYERLGLTPIEVCAGILRLPAA